MTQSQIIRDLISTARDTGKILTEISPTGFDVRRFHEMRQIGRMLMTRADDAEQAAIASRRSMVDSDSTH